MRISQFVLASALAVLPASSLQAQYFSNPGPMDPNQNNSPFWDRVSGDNGSGCNIGYVLSGQVVPGTPGSGGSCWNNQISPTYTAPFTSSFGAPGGTAWFAHENGNPDAAVGFGFAAGAGSTVRYFGGIAGASPLRDIYVRDQGTGSIVWTFQQLDASTHTFTLASSMTFDLGISHAAGGISWTGQSPFLFAAFGNGTISGGSADCGLAGCWVGAEGIRDAGDLDYNDALLQVSGATVPEPSAVALLFASAFGVAAARRKRNADAA
jgi:hypothetical protein